MLWCKRFATKALSDTEFRLQSRGCGEQLKFFSEFSHSSKVGGMLSCLSCERSTVRLLWVCSDLPRPCFLQLARFALHTLASITLIWQALHIRRKPFREEYSFSCTTHANRQITQSHPPEAGLASLALVIASASTRTQSTYLGIKSEE